MTNSSFLHCKILRIQCPEANQKQARMKKGKYDPQAGEKLTNRNKPEMNKMVAGAEKDSKMVDLKPIILIITFNVNVPNTPIKRHRLSVLIFKKA